MPIIKSAIKKMRQDAKRTLQNTKYIKAYKSILLKIKKGGAKAKTLVPKFYSAVDRAAKRKIIHKNKATRLKQSISKFLKKKK